MGISIIPLNLPEVKQTAFGAWVRLHQKRAVHVFMDIKLKKKRHAS